MRTTFILVVLMLVALLSRIAYVKGVEFAMASGAIIFASVFVHWGLGRLSR